MRDMEKPKAPQERAAGSLNTSRYTDHKLRIYSDDWDSIYVGSLKEAEMLIFALQEWIEYKRQLELWEHSE